MSSQQELLILKRTWSQILSDKGSAALLRTIRDGLVVDGSEEKTKTLYRKAFELVKNNAPPKQSRELLGLLASEAGDDIGRETADIPELAELCTQHVALQREMEKRGPEQKSIDLLQQALEDLQRREDQLTAAMAQQAAQAAEYRRRCAELQAIGHVETAGERHG